MKFEIVNKVSKKGNAYTALEIYLTPTYKKLVFLSDAEIALIQLQQNSVNK